MLTWIKAGSWAVYSLRALVDFLWILHPLSCWEQKPDTRKKPGCFLSTILLLTFDLLFAHTEQAFIITSVWCLICLCLSLSELSYFLLWCQTFFFSSCTFLFPQCWDLAKFQSQGVLLKLRMCLHSYKQDDMIKTCFKRGRGDLCAEHAGCRNAPFYLIKILWRYSQTDKLYLKKIF